MISKTPLALLASTLGLFGVAALPAFAQTESPPPNQVLPNAQDEAMKPKKGEILLTGTIERLTDNGFSLSATEFTLPTGANSRLPVAKSKMVQVGANTAIVPEGDPFWRLKNSSLQVGMPVAVVGADAGTGRGIVPRAIALTRIVSGQPQDYFVSSAGTATGDGSAGHPWLTLKQAISSIPDGTPGSPRILHIGPGDWSADADAPPDTAQLLIQHRHDLILTGTGARSDGTQISTGKYHKILSGVLRIIESRNIAFCNLIIGDDRAWEKKDAFFESTISILNSPGIHFQAVEILGPSQDTLDNAESQRAPTALRPNYGARVSLKNVLVLNHGSFLSNPEGFASCRGVTFTGQNGLVPDDTFMFLQTPKTGDADEVHFQFTDCIFYELKGSRDLPKLRLTTGKDGESRVAFAPPTSPQAGNRLVRGRGYKSNPSSMETLFDGRRDTNFSLVQGVWQNNDVRSPLTGNIKFDNDVQLSTRDGFLLSAPTGDSGWQGGFASATEVESQKDYS